MLDARNSVAPSEWLPQLARAIPRGLTDRLRLLLLCETRLGQRFISSSYFRCSRWRLSPWRSFRHLRPVCHIEASSRPSPTHDIERIRAEVITNEAVYPWLSSTPMLDDDLLHSCSTDMSPQAVCKLIDSSDDGEWLQLCPTPRPFV